MIKAWTVRKIILKVHSVFFGFYYFFQIRIMFSQAWPFSNCIRRKGERKNRKKKYTFKVARVQYFLLSIPVICCCITTTCRTHSFIYEVRVQLGCGAGPAHTLSMGVSPASWSDFLCDCSGLQGPGLAQHSIRYALQAESAWLGGKWQPPLFATLFWSYSCCPGLWLVWYFPTTCFIRPCSHQLNGEVTDLLNV